MPWRRSVAALSRQLLHRRVTGRTCRTTSTSSRVRTTSGTSNTRPDFVDHYAYQQGLLVSYWDTSYADNDTFEHPGSGRNLYVDAHPRPFYRLDGLPWRARVQVYDAPFSLTKADSFTLHHNSKAMYIRGQAAQPLFDDTKKYWYSELPNHGVKLPAVGVKIRVLSVDGTSMKVRFTS